MKTRVLIVEDDIRVAETLQLYIESADYVCAGIAVGFEEAIQILAQERIDIALLNAHIANQQVTALACYMREAYQIPFIGMIAHTDSQTIETIKAMLPWGYLKKPIQKDDLQLAIDIAIHHFTQKRGEKITLKIGKQTHFFPAHELLYAEAKHVYVSLVMTTGKHLTVRSSLATLLESLPACLLKQINRSQAINPYHIEKISGDKFFLAQQIFKISPLFKGNF